MKLIIDIDEELYKNVIEYTRNGYLGSDIWKAVANGKPYEERPNCVTCDHFGKCEGCEKGDEE